MDNYLSTNIENLKEDLKTKTIVFQYTKKDGSTRTAVGTLNPELLPPPEPVEVIKMEAQVVEDMVNLKGYTDINEYAKENGMNFDGEETTDKKYYLFTEIKKPRKKNENLQSYFDLEVNEFRSFTKEKFLGIIEYK